jgi:hypothetical protein
MMLAACWLGWLFYKNEILFKVFPVLSFQRCKLKHTAELPAPVKHSHQMLCCVILKRSMVS